MDTSVAGAIEYEQLQGRNLCMAAFLQNSTKAPVRGGRIEGDDRAGAVTIVP
jgi:hypothetical protein